VIGAASFAAAPTPRSAGSELSTFDREQSLLEQARNALKRDDTESATRALDECERSFAGAASRHQEERDYLRIFVLQKRGDRSGARPLAKAFLERYPTSLLARRVAPLAE
jgi:outer membrane protein assembly factor BamD (BamD/ComL family)